jgi:hypothetical protein
MDDLLFADEVHDMGAFAELVVAPEVMVERQLHHPAGGQRVDRLPGRGGAHPAVRGAPVGRVVVEEHAQLTGGKVHRIPLAGGVTASTLLPSGRLRTLRFQVVDHDGVKRSPALPSHLGRI